MKSMEEASAQHDHVASLGLIVGAGALPIEAVRLLATERIPCEVFGFDGISDPELGFEKNRTRLGQLAALATALTIAKVERLLIVGKFSKTLLLGSSDAISLDEEAVRLLAGVDRLDDEGLLGAIASWLEARGFEIARQDLLLASLLAAKGSLSARSPSESESADLEIGRGVVDGLARAGVGQCVALRWGCVVAVEAAEGTDAMIRRAGELAGAGATVIKVARPGQDRRFDLPAVGPDTIEVMRQAEATGLAIEAGSTLIIDAPRFRQRADEAGIAVWGFERPGSTRLAGGFDRASNAAAEVA